MDLLLKVLRPIFQPFGTDLFCFGKKFLVFNLVSRNLKVKYRRSILGLFWTLLTPLAMTAVYYFVFKVIMKIQIPQHLIFILSGVLVWNFISQTILEGMESIVGNIGLLTKVPIPVQVFPLVGAVTNYSTLVLATPVLIFVALYSKVSSLEAALICFPIYSGLFLILTYSICFILGVLFIRLRDLRHFMGIIMQIWFYATPVIYDEKMIPQKYSWIMYLNPFGFAFGDIHAMWARGEFPNPNHFMITLGWTVMLLVVAALVQKYLSTGLIEQI